jgi:hypothetical protein
MAHTSGDYWIYHGQDDLTAENYVEALVEHAARHPEAALVHGDMTAFGQVAGRWEQPSVYGATAFIRQMTMLCERHPGVAFHGLTRARALVHAGGLPSNAFENVATDTAWMAAVALSGELHRVERAIYRKRFHGHNVSGRTARWSRHRRLAAWSAHCVNMVEQALRVEGTAHELRLLWLGAVARLASPALAGYLIDVLHLTRKERVGLIDSFLERARTSSVRDIPVLLDMQWPEIEALSREVCWLPGDELIDIADFGPRTVRRGRPFQVQPDGSSAIWVRSTRRSAPGSKLRLGGVDLDTAITNTLLTAVVPEALTARPGDVALSIVGPDRRPLSRSVRFPIFD